MCGSVSVKEDKSISLSVGFRAQNYNRSTDKVSVCPSFWLPWVPEVFSRVWRGASFRVQWDVSSWPKAEDTSGEATRFLRLDRKRKPRVKSLWHRGYILTGYVNNRPEKKITVLRFERTSMFFSLQVFACLLEHSSGRAKIFLGGHHVRQQVQIYFELWVYIILKWNVKRWFSNFY